MAQSMVSMNVAEDMPRAGRFQHQFKKTTLCKFFAERNCRKGDSCNFAHNNEEICKAPDLTKTSLCKRYKSGTCNKDSASCPFAHGPRELRWTPLFRCEGKPWREDYPIDSATNGVPMLAHTPFHAQVDMSDSIMSSGYHWQEPRKAPFQPSVDSSTSAHTMGGSWWEEPRKAANMMLPGTPLPAMSGNDAKLATGLDSAPVEQHEDLSDCSSADSGSWGRESCDRLSPLPPRLVGAQMDPAMPVFFQRNVLPLSVEALESLLKNAMPDQYED